ncbi:MAG TPA: hypothetical protein DEP23_01825 [Ruminococcaceae bacterium]|nr:hypothetical protein [Oscillospiraceae bacterium]
MAETIYKVLGKRGRITIPWEIRKELGFAYNDVISFVTDGSSVTVKREKLCTGCQSSSPLTEEKETTVALKELLDDLNPDELRSALIYLSIRWAEYSDSLPSKIGGSLKDKSLK